MSNGELRQVTTQPEQNASINSNGKKRILMTANTKSDIILSETFKRFS
jgi:hypothetical protein